MGLVRGVLRLVPPAALFLAGYYVGTVHSGKYNCVFRNQTSSHQTTQAPSADYQAPTPSASSPALERAYEQVIAYVGSGASANHMQHDTIDTKVMTNGATNGN